MNSVTNKDRHLMEDQASRQKRKIRSYVFFIVLFTVIIGSIITVSIALIQEKESELLSASTPDRAIHAICNLTPKPISCFDSIWSLRTNFSTDLGEIKTTPSRIFARSLGAAVNQLEDSISANEKAISEVKDSRTLTVLKDCDVLLRDSLRLVNASVTAMGVESDDKIFKAAKSVDDMKEWMSSSAANIDKCLAGLRYHLQGSINGKSYHSLREMRIKVSYARDGVANSLVMLEKMDTILGMFNQTIFHAIFEFDILEYLGFGLVLYVPQYLVLVVLICTVLRL
ncbi:unnamed protein product [Coffea canephora]|uniref:Pectinesterase inhibitor domain-containing protein n=1 Tax=Coffea canephora TaxID=49390 RepID=A0A068UVL8_COFCA|nr:unnamed protein product [Coffea canephora]